MGREAGAASRLNTLGLGPLCGPLQPETKGTTFQGLRLAMCAR